MTPLKNKKGDRLRKHCKHSTSCRNTAIRCISCCFGTCLSCAYRHSFRSGPLHGPNSGGRRDSLQQKKTVCVSPRCGPQRLGLHGSGRRTPILCATLCLSDFIITNILSRRKLDQVATQVCVTVGYCRCLHHSAVISLHFSFLSSTFELESTPHIHCAVVFSYGRSDSVQ